MTAPEHDLERFVQAQAPVHDTVVAELRAGKKQSHWMWFVFPQLLGLGRSQTARDFAIRSLDEARAYLAHPVLGPRLRECARLVLDTHGLTAHDIFGSPDDRKLHSCATLFLEASGEPVFRELLDRFYEGRRDDATLRLLAGQGQARA